MKNMIKNYKSMIQEISDEVTAGMLLEKDHIQILRADQPVVQDYRPIVDWYYDTYTMKEELELPLEERFMDDEFTKEEWAEMKAEHEAYKKQYEAEKEKLQDISVKDALTEMKQMLKLFRA